MTSMFSIGYRYSATMLPQGGTFGIITYIHIWEIFMSSIAKKLDQIRLRVSPEHKETLRFAAACKGQDLTSYILGCVLERAKQDIKEDQEVHSILLSNRDFQKVVKELKNPSKPNEKLKKAFKKHGEKFGDE